MTAKKAKCNEKHAILDDFVCLMFSNAFSSLGQRRILSTRLTRVLPRNVKHDGFSHSTRAEKLDGGKTNTMHLALELHFKVKTTPKTRVT